VGTCHIAPASCLIRAACFVHSLLSYQAPAHGFGWTRQLVERSFGASFETLFADFDETPFASGSIGQVHAATLRADGTQVAIKVQHPNLAWRLALDMALLRGARPALQP